jgi:TolB-like protein
MRLAVACLVLVAASIASAAPSGGRTRVAVTDIKNVQGVAPGTATILTDIVVNEVARAGFGVVSQSDIDAMLGFEKKKQMLGCTEETSCLAEIGGALGVDYLFSGQVGKMGSRYRLSLMVVDAKRAAVVARAAQFTDADEDDLARTAEEMVAKLTKEIWALRQAAAAPRAAEPRPAVAGAQPPSHVTPAPAAAKVDLAPRPPVSEAAPVAPEPEGSRRFGRRAGWWAVGGGGAALVVGAVAGLTARAKLNALKDGWADNNYPSLYDSKSGDVKSFALIADVCFVAGVATAGWGTWLLLRKEPESMPVAVAPVPLVGGGAIVATGRF